MLSRRQWMLTHRRHRCTGFGKWVRAMRRRSSLMMAYPLINYPLSLTEGGRRLSGAIMRGTLGRGLCWFMCYFEGRPGLVGRRLQTLRRRRRDLALVRRRRGFRFATHRDQLLFPHGGVLAYWWRRIAGTLHIRRHLVGDISGDPNRIMGDSMWEIRTR